MNTDKKMKVNIVVACDKYKGSLSAVQVCKTIKHSILEVDKKINVITCPMADGGEGTVDTLVESLKGKYIELTVTNPVGKKIKSRLPSAGAEELVTPLQFPGYQPVLQCPGLPSQPNPRPCP